MKRKSKGFTLIELMVVISIIGMLSSLVLAATVSARQKGLVAKTQTQLIQIRNGIAVMANDTGLWPNGCAIGKIVATDEPGGSNEIALDDPAAGLLVKPTVGSGDVADFPNCTGWTQTAVDRWNGPYINFSPIDTWGSPFWFDSDYEAYANCESVTNKPGTLTVIVSPGPNKLGPPYNTDSPTNVPPLYDCDDVFIRLF